MTWKIMIYKPHKHGHFLTIRRDSGCIHRRVAAEVLSLHRSDLDRTRWDSTP
jgi:hypothetical protein